MDEERLRADEYEKQYYGFSSTEFYEDFKEKVSKAVIMALKEMDVALRERQHEGILKDKIIEMHSVYMEKASIPLQKFQEETRKIFAIPKNVLLKEDKYNVDQYSDEDLTELEKEVNELEKKLLQEQVFLAKCTQMKEIADTVIKPMYDKVNSLIKYINQLPDGGEVDENEKKLLKLREDYMQYYCSNEAEEKTEDLQSFIAKNYVQKS